MVRVVLQGWRALLAIVLLLQGLQLVLAFTRLDAMAVATSPQLWPALLLKTTLLVLNVALLWLSHWALSRR